MADLIVLAYSRIFFKFADVFRKMFEHLPDQFFPQEVQSVSWLVGWLVLDFYT